jgi:hypothetical protein
MKFEQNQFTAANGWMTPLGRNLGKTAQLVLLFGATDLLREKSTFDQIKGGYPNAHVMGCSTAGEIRETQVFDETLVLTAVEFKSSRIQGANVRIADVKSGLEAGQKLAAALPKEDLVHVFVLSDGLLINGSELVEGMTQKLPPGVSVTGGLSGDGERFKETLVLLDGPAESGLIAAIGFYGKGLRVGYGSVGGWDPFGPERVITRSKGNVLYELDRKSALELYKKYLGDHAKGLPSTGLLFPLSLRTSDTERGVVRTILSVNEQDQTMTFAGDVPTGSLVRLMKANFDRLIDGSSEAARISCGAQGVAPPAWAILISCVGRKLVLQQRVEEEVEGVREVLGGATLLSGFYSYGEISPFNPDAKCELHNQTMTITTFWEN